MYIARGGSECASRRIKNRFESSICNALHGEQSIAIVCWMRGIDTTWDSRAEGQPNEDCCNLAAAISSDL